VSSTIFIMKSLILAQDERWRRGLGMQVERERPAPTFGKQVIIFGNSVSRRSRCGISRVADGWV